MTERGSKPELPEHDDGPLGQTWSVRLWVILATVVCVVVAVGVGLSSGDHGDRERDPPEQPTVTPEDLGAVGDGEQDDTEAVQAALDTAAASGARVLLRAGRTYLIGAPLQLPSGSHLTGQGATSVLHFSWSTRTYGEAPYYLGNENQSDGNSDIVLDNFAVVGAGDGRPLGPNYTGPIEGLAGIRLRLVDRLRVTRLTVSNVPGISILYQGTSEVVIRRNHVHHSGRDGITGTSFTSPMHDVVVADNVVDKVGDDGIAVISASFRNVLLSDIPRNVVVRDNTIEGWPSNPNGLVLGRGILVSGAADVAVVDNDVTRTRSYGILVQGAPNPASIDPETGETFRSSDVRVIGNRIEDAGQNVIGSAPFVNEPGHDAILVADTDRAVVRDNEVVNPFGQDLATRSCEDCSVVLPD